MEKLIIIGSGGHAASIDVIESTKKLKNYWIIV